MNEGSSIGSARAVCPGGRSILAPGVAQLARFVGAANVDPAMASEINKKESIFVENDLEGGRK